MVPELEKPRVIEINVRMDCNGCVQKIKKALLGINGIYDVQIDFPQQKVTIIGWADPEKIVKAIKKVRKVATICALVEPTGQAAQPTEQAAAEAGTPAPDTPSPPPPEASPAEQAPPAEPPKDPPPPENPAPPENPPHPEAKPSPTATDTNTGQPTGLSRRKDVEEVHVIYHQPPDYRYRYDYSHAYGAHWNNYHNGQGIHNEPPQPIYATHSYNTYRPSPYVTEYEYVRSPPQYTHYSRMDHYSEDYRSASSSTRNNGNITSLFSDENPNACRIV